MAKKNMKSKLQKNMWAVYIAIAVLEFVLIGGLLGALAAIPMAASFIYRKLKKDALKWVIVIMLIALAVIGILSKILGFTLIF